MRGGPTPGAGLPPDPLGGELWRVSYRTQRGETASRLFRHRAAARRFAAGVLDHGGDVRLHSTRLAGWREEHPCVLCEIGSKGHNHDPRPPAESWTGWT